MVDIVSDNKKQQFSTTKRWFLAEQLLAVLADRGEWDRLVKSHFIY